MEGKGGQIGEKPEDNSKDDSKDEFPRSSTGKPPAVGTGSSRSPRATKSKRRCASDEVSDWEGDDEWVPAPKPKRLRSM